MLPDADEVGRFGCEGANLGAALGLAEPAVDDRARARDVPSPNLKVKWRQKQVKRRQKKVKWI